MTEFLYPLLLIKLAFRFGAKIKYGLLVNLIDFWNSVKKKPAVKYRRNKLSYYMYTFIRYQIPVWNKKTSIFLTLLVYKNLNLQ